MTQSYSSRTSPSPRGQLSPEGHSFLQHIIPKLDEITEEVPFLITESPYRIERVRSYLYRYLKVTGLSASFKLIRLSPEKLQIRRRLSPVTSFSHDSELTSIAQAVLDSCFQCNSFTEAMDKAREAFHSNTITQREFFAIETHLERVFDSEPPEPPFELRRPETLTDPFALFKDEKEEP